MWGKLGRQGPASLCNVLVLCDKAPAMMGYFQYHIFLSREPLPEERRKRVWYLLYTRHRAYKGERDSCWGVGGTEGVRAGGGN